MIRISESPIEKNINSTMVINFLWQELVMLLIQSLYQLLRISSTFMIDSSRICLIDKKVLGYAITLRINSLWQEGIYFKDK